MYILLAIIMFALPFTICYLLLQRWQNHKDNNREYIDDELILPEGKEAAGIRWDLIISTATGLGTLYLFLIFN